MSWRRFVSIGVSCLGIFLGQLTIQAACPTCTTFEPGVLTGLVAFTALDEASGVAASARSHGVLWAHNDGSNGRVYAIATNGARLATYEVNGVDDVEDIAVGPGPVAGVSYLYIGDVGGGVGLDVVRPQVRIVRVTEPLVELTWANNPHTADFTGINTFTLTYPDGSYNAETLFVDPLTSDLWIVTKDTNVARIYRANVNALPNNGVAVLEFVRQIDFNLASGGDMSADGMRIALRNETSAVLWNRCDAEPVNTALGRPSQTIPIVGFPTEPKGEGIGFLRDGSGYVTVSEGTNSPIYFFRSTCPAPPQFTSWRSNVTAFVGGTVQLQGRAAGFPDPVYTWSFGGEVLAETGPVLTLPGVSAASQGQYQVTASNVSGVISTSATLVVRLKPDLRVTEAMSVASPSSGVPTADWWELTSFDSEPVDLSGWRFNDGGGALNDPHIIGGPLVISPGESIIFAEQFNREQFLTWWGANNMPANIQVYAYSGSGLGFGAGGDGIRLWDNLTTDSFNTVASGDFGAANAGVTFTYNPATQLFGEYSQWGVNGAFLAPSGFDVGSPGWIGPRPAFPVLLISRTGNTVRIEFDAEAGRRYELEVRENLSTGSWIPTGSVLQTTTAARMFFERSINQPEQFFRVSVQ